MGSVDDISTSGEHCNLARGAKRQLWKEYKKLHYITQQQNDFDTSSLSS
jgi:hypothetical protein